MRMLYTRRYACFAALFAGAVGLLGCSSEKNLRKRHNNLVDLKYSVSELEKKYNALEVSVGHLAGQFRSVGKLSFSEQNKLEVLSKKEGERENKISSNSMRINSLELDVSQIKNYLSDKNEKTDILSKRLNSLSKRVIRVPEKVREGRKTSPAAAKKTVDERGMYEDSMTLMELGKFRDAIKNFEKFRESFPKSSLLDNAQYWTGECYYALKDFNKAVEEFQKVLVGNFPNKNKAPDAMLKKGFAYGELKQNEKAVSTFKKLIDTYGEQRKFQYIVGRARAKIAEISSP